MLEDVRDIMEIPTVYITFGNDQHHAIIAPPQRLITSYSPLPLASTDAFLWKDDPLLVTVLVVVEVPPLLPCECAW